MKLETTLCLLKKDNQILLAMKKRGFGEGKYNGVGGKIEEGETPEEGTIREIEEEFGIKVKIVKKLYEIKMEKLNQKEIFFLCEYIEGKFGTGKGPEFSNDPKYADSGKYVPEIVNKEKIKNILLLPTEIRDKFIKDLCYIY